MVKHTHCIFIVLIIFFAIPAFSAPPSEWSIVRQADWQTNFQDVTFVDQTHAWAVGDFGVIATTADGGKTWTSQTSGVQSRLNSVMFLDLKNGWIVGDDGVILNTINGGTKWTQKKINFKGNLTDIFFINAKSGWVIGNQTSPSLKGYIFYTADGGNTWKEQKSLETPLIDIYFADVNVGWVVGGTERTRGTPGTALLLRTTDGGKTWNQQNINAQSSLSSVYFADKNNGWVFGSGGSFKTNDGGNTWVSMSATSTPPPQAVAGEGGEAPPQQFRRMGASSFRKVSVVNPTDIWGINTAGNLARMGEDGRIQNVNAPARRLTGIDFFSPQIGCVVGEFGTILTTKDGGKTWENPNKVKPETIRSVASATKDNIWCVGDNGVAYQSVDGGKTWSQVNVGVPGNIQAITFADANNGWMIVRVPSGGRGRGGGEGFGGEGGPPPGFGGEGGPPFGMPEMDAEEAGPTNTILKTTDGGKTWTVQASGSEFNMNAIRAINSQVAYMCGGNGAVYATKDGGNTWNRLNVGVVWDLADISFPNENNGWAVGWTGLVMRTDDGGENWTRLNTYTAYDINGVCFINDKKGWAVGNYGLILTTDDGGETWNSQRCYSYNHLNKVLFTDANNGWAIGNSGALFATKDGGKTWKQSQLPIAGNLYDIKKGADGAIWIAGDWGVVLRSSK